MIAFDAELDRGQSKAELELARAAFLRATSRALDRMGLFVEARAVQNAAVNTGRHRGSIHKDAEPTYNPLTSTWSIRVNADSAHSLYVEMGFQGHFVPFRVAPDMYRWAISHLGWKVPPPGNPRHPRPGQLYLIPRGRKYAVAGMVVSGKAQPSLRPAVHELDEKGLRESILREEFERELAKLR